MSTFQIQPAFVDWTSADPVQDHASGILGNVTVSLEGPLGNSFISNEYDGYGWSAFDPQLPVSDAVEMRSSAPGSEFEVRFRRKVKNPIFHIASLASTMKFTNLPPGATVEEVSSDTDFEVVSADTVRGHAHEAAVNSEGILVTDSNGTIRLTGDRPYRTIRFTLTPNFAASVPDGVLLQIGGTGGA